MKPSMYFKSLENKSVQKLDKSRPFIVRLDGVGFSKWTRKNCIRPFDDRMHRAMQASLEELMRFSQSCKFGYTHSDEMSLLFDFSNNPEASLQYDGKISKICSIYSSVVTEVFNLDCRMFMEGLESPAHFDCRAFNLESEQDVRNYFLWRYEDSIRNSVQALADHHFSSKELLGKSVENQKQMLLERFPLNNWESQPNEFRFGTIVHKFTTMRLLTGPELIKIPEHLREQKRTELVKRHDFEHYSPINESVFDNCLGAV